MAEILHIDDICRRTGLKKSTVYSKLRSNEFGKFEYVDNNKDMIRLEDGAVEEYVVAKTRERAARASQKKEKPKKKTKLDLEDGYVMVHTYTPAEAEAIAQERADNFRDDHAEDWVNLSDEDVSKRVDHYRKLHLGRLLSTKHKVKMSQVTEGQKRLAYIAPVFVADHIDRLNEDDSSYFIAQLVEYEDAKYFENEVPQVKFLVIQLIDEQIRIRRLQAVMELSDLASVEALDKSLTSAMNRYNNISKAIQTLMGKGTPGDDIPPQGSGLEMPTGDDNLNMS